MLPDLDPGAPMEAPHTFDAMLADCAQGDAHQFAVALDLTSTLTLDEVAEVLPTGGEA